MQAVPYTWEQAAHAGVFPSHLLLRLLLNTFTRQPMDLVVTQTLQVLHQWSDV